MLASIRLGSDPQLQKASANSPPLKSGDEGTGVAKVQDLLADLGFTLTVSLSSGEADGIFGSETQAAVKSFQANNALSPDGIVGTLTLAALDAIVLSNARLEEKDGPNNFCISYW